MNFIGLRSLIGRRLIENGHFIGRRLIENEVFIGLYIFLSEKLRVLNDLLIFYRK